MAALMPGTRPPVPLLGFLPLGHIHGASTQKCQNLHCSLGLLVVFFLGVYKLKAFFFVIVTCFYFFIKIQLEHCIDF